MTVHDYLLWRVRESYLTKWSGALAFCGVIASQLYLQHSLAVASTWVAAGLGVYFVVGLLAARVNCPCCHQNLSGEPTVAAGIGRGVWRDAIKEMRGKGELAFDACANCRCSFSGQRPPR